MADEIAINATPAAAQPVATDAAAASPTSVITPTATTPNVSAAESAVDAVIGSEPAKVEAVVEKPVTPEVKPAEPSLLTPDPKVETKPTEAEKPVEGEKKEEAAQSDEPAPLPTYEKFVLPEGITVEEAKLSDFTKQLGEFERTTKASHEEVQKLGQQLVDRHIAEVTQSLERQRDLYVQEWNKKKEGWVEQFKADPELGGKRFETSLREAKEFIKTHGGSQENIDSFYNALKETGADAHPDIVRFLLNVKNSSTFKTPVQLAAPKPAPEAKSKIAKRYGSTS